MLAMPAASMRVVTWLRGDGESLVNAAGDDDEPDPTPLLGVRERDDWSSALTFSSLLPAYAPNGGHVITAVAVSFSMPFMAKKLTGPST